MKLIAYFDSFLKNTVNLNDTRLKLLRDRSDAIVNYLKRDELFADLVSESIPQGSYAQKTIIRPRPGGTFDADLLVQLDPIPGWSASEYVGKLYSALGRNPVYKEKRHRRTRCVYVDYADDFHVDLVPYIEKEGTGYITNNKEDKFEHTMPKGFTSWLEDRNDDANGHLEKVIRLIKYRRDTTYGFNVKSVILTTLIGNRVTSLKSDRYPDVPSTLVAVVDDLDNYLAGNPSMPIIADPGGTSDQFDRRWDQEGYASFSKSFHTFREQVDLAFAAEGTQASLEAWQIVFGASFKAPIEKSSALVEAEHAERFIDLDFGYPFSDRLAAVKMEGRVQRSAGLESYRLTDRGNRVTKHRKIIFEVTDPGVPGAFEIYWKVKNSGYEAARADSLRGEIQRGTGTWVREESTLYEGAHWVECYVVKDGWVVGRARQNVIVE